MREDDNPQPNVGEDVYVIEDTGESLADFQYDRVAKGEDAPAAPAGEAALAAENQKLRDQLLRNLADFENFRKRSEREKADFRRLALADFMRDLLPVVDNLERAIASDAQALEDYRKGVELTHKSLVETLQRKGLEPVDQAGVPFDPNIHEAVMQEQDESLPNHSVSQILQKGYFLTDRLLRPALVKVAVGGPERSREEPPEASAESEEPAE